MKEQVWYCPVWPGLLEGVIFLIKSSHDGIEGISVSTIRGIGISYAFQDLLDYFAEIGCEYLGKL